MFRLLESGFGKMWCDSNGVIYLYDTLSQSKLKYLFNAKCQFITYDKDTRREETTQSEAVPPSGEKDTEDISDGSIGRTSNKRKANKKRANN